MQNQQPNPQPKPPSTQQQQPPQQHSQQLAPQQQSHPGQVGQQQQQQVGQQPPAQNQNPGDGRVANESAKQALMAALQKKRKVDKQLADIEAKIYAFEGSYLEESSQTGGNIVKGFDGYLKPPTTGGAHKKKYEATEADRLFSSSSLTFQRSLDFRADAGL